MVHRIWTMGVREINKGVKKVLHNKGYILVNRDGSLAKAEWIHAQYLTISGDGYIYWEPDVKPDHPVKEIDFKDLYALRSIEDSWMYELAESIYMVILRQALKLNKADMTATEFRTWANKVNWEKLIKKVLDRITRCYD